MKYLFILSLFSLTGCAEEIKEINVEKVTYRDRTCVARLVPNHYGPTITIDTYDRDYVTKKVYLNGYYELRVERE